MHVHVDVHIYIYIQFIGPGSGLESAHEKNGGGGAKIWKTVTPDQLPMSKRRRKALAAQPPKFLLEYFWRRRAVQSTHSSRPHRGDPEYFWRRRARTRAGPKPTLEQVQAHTRAGTAGGTPSSFGGGGRRCGCCPGLEQASKPCFRILEEGGNSFSR